MTHDLTFVAPERRAEVNRRIDVIERFTKRPGRKAADSCAAALGLSTGQFYTLVKAWTLTRRPESIAGSGRPRTRPSTINDVQAAIIAEAAAARGRPQDVLRRAFELAAERDVSMPHISAVRRHYERTRPRHLPDAFTAFGDALVMDACAVGVAVRDQAGDAVRPVLTAVIDVRRDRLIGASLSTAGYGPASAAAALADALATTQPQVMHTDATLLTIGRWIPSGQDWTDFDQTIASAGIGSSNIAAGKDDRSRGITGLLGTRHAGIQLLPRLTLSDVARRAAAEQDGDPVSIAVASDMLRGRFVGRPTANALAMLDDVDRRVLLDGLEGLAKDCG